MKKAFKSKHFLLWNSKLLLILTGIAGFYLGMVKNGSWQLSLESSQVLAGIVQYPASNPFFIYHAKLWTLINQLPAFFLAIGFSEITLSLIMSGILGMLSFQALSLMVWSISRIFLAALVSPLIIYLYIVNGYGAEWGRSFDSLIYPLYLMGTIHTYGPLATSFVVLTFSVIGTGLYGIGSFLIFIAPAVHPTLGTACLLVLALALTSEWKNLRAERKQILIFGLLGLTVTAISLMVQNSFISTIDAPELGREIRQNIILSYVRCSDVHRQPVNLKSWGMLAHISIILLSVQHLVVFKKDISVPVRVMLRAIVILTMFSIIFSCLSRIPDHLPIELLVAMPGRLQNIVLMVFPVLLIALLASQMNRLLSAVLLLIYMAAMIIISLFDLPIDACIIPVFIAFLSAGLHAMGFFNKPLLRDPGTKKLRISANIALAAFLVLSVLIIQTGSGTWQETKGSLVDWSNNDKLALTGKGNGTLLTASNISMIQLLTRRPILLNGGALDQLPYFPESAPMMDNILYKVYGVDLFTPDCTEKRAGALNSHEGRFLWESRTRQQWQELAREFGFTDVITYDDWRLDLPVKTGVGPFLLYGIPE